MPPIVWGDEGCENTADRPLVCGGQPLDETGDWANNSPCCCFIAASNAASNEWIAEFDVGWVTISTIDFLGRNFAVNSYTGDGVDIEVKTSESPDVWEICG